MKKILTILVLLLLSVTLGTSAKNLTFSQAFNQISKKPIAVLVYADWAESYQSSLANFRGLQNTYLGQYFNFVELDIASKETKFFNDKYKISTKLPYVMLLRNDGKVSRHVTRECLSESACVTSKMKAFIL